MNDDKYYIIKKSENNWRREEPIVEELMKSFKNIISNKLDKLNLVNVITKALVSEYDQNDIQKYILAFDEIFDDENYQVNFKEIQEIIKSNEDYKIKFETIKKQWSIFKDNFDTASITASGESNLAMQRSADQLSKEIFKNE